MRFPPSYLLLESATRKIEKLFRGIQDDVLDEYNKGTISGVEMKNILKWCEDMKEKLIEEKQRLAAG